MGAALFGYVTINQDELKIREYKRYRGFYCGLCDSLRRQYGLFGQIILPYDMAFLDILLNGLYETPLREKDIRCIPHPLEKQRMLSNEITDYCADMGLLLAYYKTLDDIRDEGGIKARTGAGVLKRSARKCARRWPRQAEAVAAYIRSQEEYEKGRGHDLDAAAGFTGTALGELFVYKEDMWSDILRRMGYFLGKFVYLMDAYEDLEKDLKKGRYNPWEEAAKQLDYDAYVENVLTMMMAECAKEFEKLPIVQDIDILRNIIYSGVWMKYRIVRRRRDGQEEVSE